MIQDLKEVDCPRCGGGWYMDLDESGTPYTCYHCCNGTLKCYDDDLVYLLRKRAEIRRQIPSRKSVQENQPDRLSDLLEKAANEIERLRNE